MQLEFDWARRERCAQRNLESLSQVGVSTVQNAVVYLLQMHPDSRLIEPETKLTALQISHAAAARWLKHNCPLVRNLELDRSTVRRSVLDWVARGVAAIIERRIVMCFVALSEWHSAREVDDEELVAAWQDVTGRDRAGPSVTASVSDGENSKKNLSLNPSNLLSTLPPEVWDAALLSESKLYETLRNWWNDHGHGVGFDANQVIGAILAARTGKASPIKYAVTCLEKGVNEDWILKAANWRRRMMKASAYTGR